MDIISISNEVYGLQQELGRAYKSLFKLARIKAESELEYRKGLAIELMKLRTEGTPVSILTDLAKGNVAELLFNRDLSESRHRALLESIEAMKSQLSALQSILRNIESL
jgi:hypothetical protein